MKIAKVVIEGENIRGISDILYNYRDDSQADKPYIYSSGNIVVIMRETYYLRINSTLMSVTILKFIDDKKVEMELVASGGKEGMMMFSWGSENSENRHMIHEIMRICDENSWKIASVEPEELKEAFTKVVMDKFKNKILNTFKK